MPKTCSYGALAKGCRLCLSEKVLPIYVTFKCNKSCFYCPVLPKLQGRDFVLTPYKKIKSIKEILRIAENFSAASISGGDPLCTIDRKSTRLNSSHSSISYAV